MSLGRRRVWSRMARTVHVMTPYPARQIRTGDSGLGVHCRLRGTDPNPAPLALNLKAALRVPDRPA
jgi:hypothetical protein